MLFDRRDFPNLHPGNHRRNGPAANDLDYNCIAWAAGYNDRVWDAFAHWPEGVPPDDEITSLIMAYETEGFVARTSDDKAIDGTLEAGIEKVAIYSRENESVYQHAARQLENGTWTSKMGRKEERIEHDAPENLLGPLYGQNVTFMKRKRRFFEPFTHFRFFYLFPLGCRAYVISK